MNLIPPGYADAREKKGNDKFGDLVIWLELIEYAKTVKKPVILVTDDTKEDWYTKFSGKTIGPRPELIREMRQEAGVAFYAYRTDQFMEHAERMFKLDSQEGAIEEVRSVRQQDEQLRQMIDAEEQDEYYEFLAQAEEDYVSSKQTTAGNLQRPSTMPHFLPNDHEYKVGQKVKHKVFGQGTVLGCTGNGDMAQVMVAFPNVGVKRLVAGFARLEKV